MGDSQSLEIEVREAIKLMQEKQGKCAKATWTKLGALGAVGMLSSLMNNANVQSGFKVLRDNNLLDKTFEAIIIRYRHLFSPDVVEVAQWRLENADKL